MCLEEIGLGACNMLTILGFKVTLKGWREGGGGFKVVVGKFVGGYMHVKPLTNLEISMTTSYSLHPKMIVRVSNLGDIKTRWSLTD